MYNISITNASNGSYVECEEYLPLRVVFDPSIGENRFVGFYGGKENLLEFTVSNQTNIIKKLQVVICKNYEIVGTDLALPHPEKNGSIHLSNPQHNNCDVFKMSVYNDGIVIRISEKSPNKYYAMAQVLFGVGEDNELVSVTIANLSTNDISHTIFELQAE